MRGFPLLLLLLASATQAQVVPAEEPTPASFIPPGYRLLHEGRNRAVGDLNGDGRPDVALALTSVAEDTTLHPSDNLPPRLLLVLWRTVAGGYRLAAQSRQALLHRNSSAMGDPYDGIAIRHGVLLVRYDVGGNNGHSTTARFRYQRGGFYLIGETDAYGTHRPSCDNLPYPPGYTYRDTNLVTGEYELLKTSSECKVLMHRRGRQPVRLLQKFGAYWPAS